MQPAGVAPSPHASAERWLDAARWSAIVGACTVMVSPPLANVAIVAMLICFFASGEAWPRLRQSLAQPLAIGALLVIAVIALGMLWSTVPWGERWRAFYAWRKLWIVPVLLALFGPLLWKERLLAAFVAVCAAAAMVSFALVAQSGLLPSDQYHAAASVLRNHAAQSMAFAAAVFIAVWAASRPETSPKLRFAAVVAAVLLALNLAFVTPGRSGYLALLVMLAVFAAGRLRSWRSLAIGGTLGVLFAAAMAVSPLARDRIGLALHELQTVRQAEAISSMGIRVIMYENTLQLARERPLIGVGTGGFGEAYAALAKTRYSDWRAQPSLDPHNQYLFFLAEQGLVGLAAFLAFIALALADRGDGGPTRLLAIGLLLAWCATSLLSSHFQTFAEGHLLAFLLAAMLARPAARDAAAAPSGPGR